MRLSDLDNGDCANGEHVLADPGPPALVNEDGRQYRIYDRPYCVLCPYEVPNPKE